MTDEHGPDIPEQRKYLPTLAELIDRLSIVLLKAIFIPENHQEYLDEKTLIEHDIDLELRRCNPRPKSHWTKVINARIITATLMLMLSNRYIWENESKARQGGKEQDKLLKLTHSINGVRSTAKNIIAREFGNRVDLKVDCFAAELEKEFGRWDVFTNA